MIFTRGLAALTLTLLFSLNLYGKFLYIDDVTNNAKFADEIEQIGQELYQKTGVSLYVVMVRGLDGNKSTVDLEKSLIPELKQPFVLMTFVEKPTNVDILARPESVYKDFDKDQVLSPDATFASAVASAIMFARTWKEWKAFLGHYGGTILPILGQKTKGPDTVKKYSVAMFNGYEDVSMQIAASHGVKLKSNPGKGGTIVMDIVRLLFYGIILYAIIMYIRNRFFRRKQSNEQ